MPSRRCSCAFESHDLSPFTLGLGENEKAVSPRAAGSSGQSACQWRRVLDTQLRRLNVQCPRCSEGRRSAMLRKLQPWRHSLGHTCVMGQVVAHGAGVAPHIHGSDRGHGSMFWRSSQGSQSQPSPGPSFQNSISKPRRNRALQSLTAFRWFDVTVPILWACSWACYLGFDSLL